MPDFSGPGPAPGSSKANERKLEGWGEIASYLRREIRTVQRWEKTLGLPIHRLSVGKQSSVYAYPSELDRWYREREPKIKAEEIQHAENVASAIEAKSQETAVPAPVSPALQPARRSPDRRLFWLSGIAAILLVLLLISRFSDLSFLKPASAVSSTDKLRLFVRPFQTVAGDAAQTEFSEGLTSEINNRLSRLDP